ncbi:MAG: hypothetical protein MUF42_00875 [Cytophagaceae bacterium]|jgi:hypothetical protein|nr:hypothetical protein [Cytophagaceae bacterium]
MNLLFAHPTKNASGLLALLLFACLLSSCSQPAPDESYDLSTLSEVQRNKIEKHFRPFFLLKPDKVKADDRFHDSLSSHYETQAQLCAMQLKAYKDLGAGNHAVLFQRKDLKSLYNDYRALGATFRMTQDSIAEVKLYFLTQMLRPDTVQRVGALLFKELVEKKNIDAYVNDREMIYWPGNGVVYNVPQKKWVLNDSIPLQ